MVINIFTWSGKRKNTKTTRLDRAERLRAEQQVMQGLIFTRIAK